MEKENQEDPVQIDLGMTKLRVTGTVSDTTSLDTLPVLLLWGESLFQSRQGLFLDGMHQQNFFRALPKFFVDPIMDMVLAPAGVSLAPS